MKKSTAKSKPKPKAVAKPKTRAKYKTKTRIKTKTKVAAQSTIKTAAKPAAKKKPVVRKTPAAKKKLAVRKTSKRETVTTLAQSLKSLESRLKGADTRNRNAVKALGKTVTDIQTTAKRGSTTHKAALTRGLNKLEVRMETYLKRASAKAKAGVRADLASVTASGADLSTLENAVQTAHNRLNQLDATQREALARINRHVAGLAASMDKRLSAENEARTSATAELDAKITSVRDHVDQVEEETATALEAVGAKVAEFAGVLEERAKTSDAETAERLANIAKESQSGFTAAQSDLTARLEALEVIASAWSPSQDKAAAANPYLPANAEDPRIDQMGTMIANLQEELSRMHARIATVQHTAHTETVQKPALSPTNVLPMAVVQTQIQENPYSAVIETAAPEPKVTASPAKPRESHVPQEFDPSAFEANQASFETRHGDNPPQAPYASASLMPPVAAAPLAVPPIAPTPLAPPMASTCSHSPVPKAPAIAEPVMAAPEPVLTYDDPAYAEGDEMRAERIVDASAKRASRPKRSLPKLPISGQNLRIGGLAVGVAVAGLFAAKTILGGPDSGPLEEGTDAVQNASYATPSEDLTLPAPQNTDFGSPAASPAAAENPNAPTAPIAPLGQYAETKTPTFDKSGTNTLDAAVEAGDPIAQFQKGLAQLQSGQMEDGARLIRLSANRNQPAAQYRLAKLYETGTGLAKDPITARELIERAASGGNRIAMHDLGNYHAYGQGGLQQDIGSALEWFTKAAERGVVDSQFNVAFLREGNEGVPADVETAYFWYHIAARQGDQGAPDRIKLLNEKIDSAKQAEIKARADSFNPKAVDEAANGIFRNVAWAKQAGLATSASKSAEILKIRDAQTLLGQLGYEVGAPDGISGSKTRDAVKSFEAVNGLPETGQITDDLIERLEIATGA